MTPRETANKTVKVIAMTPALWGPKSPMTRLTMTRLIDGFSGCDIREMLDQQRLTKLLFVNDI